MQLHGGHARAPVDRARPARAPAWLRWAAVLACVFASSPWPALAAAAQPEDGTGQVGEAQVGEVLRDPDFGVTTRHAGLQRHVEMYQWTRDGSGYALEWRGARVDSSGFAPGHENPRQIPLREREWRAPVSLDGRPVPENVLNALGKWQQFRPNFSALPGNMSATFQPEGDGLGSAENPLAPEVGDLRISWRALVLPPLAERLVLRDGEWTLRETTAAPTAAEPGVQPGAQPRPQPRRWPTWLLFAAAAAVVVLGLAIARRRKP